MPTNRFPDSIQKRALRLRDGRSLQQFAEHIGRGLDYCGMPSVEFLDVEAWRGVLRSVVGVEYDPEVANDMRIELDRRAFPFPVRIVEDDISHLLVTAKEAFDVYNLDFYTGFVNVRSVTVGKSVDAIREVFRTQGKARRSFTLITTFNVRDQGAGEYLKFLQGVSRELTGHTNSKENLAAHSATQPGRLKLCFPFFCWQQAGATGFEHDSTAVYVYHSLSTGARSRHVTHTMVHFHQRFKFREGEVLPVPMLQTLIDLANQPLYELKEEIPYKHMVPPRIDSYVRASPQAKR